MEVMNATIVKFGYPDTLIREYRHWLLLLRPAQVTAGSLVLAARSDVTAFGDLPDGAHGELASITHDLEQMLKRATDYQKINYLMLMMVDPHVHFHIFPRYEGSRTVAGVAVSDSGWPGPPNLQSAISLTAEQLGALVEYFKNSPILQQM